LILTLAAAIGGPIQIVHLSAPHSAQLIREARARGLDVTAETCPQYLFLDRSALTTHGPYAKCNPALRSPAEVAQMWVALRDGTIDVIGSDHSPYVAAEKERGWANIFDTPAGVPGLETTLPLLLTAAHQGRIGISEIARLTSERAAAIFKLPGKGQITLGADADLTIVDLNAEWVFDHTKCLTKARDCMRLWDGQQMHGQVVGTLVRGVEVFRHGQIVAQPGHGRFIRPKR
jgi:dihydroorotase-like cyclic amidohydrolase